MKDFFLPVHMEKCSRKLSIAMVQSVSQGGAMLLAWIRQQSKCGVTFRNLEVPSGACRPSARSCPRGSGRFSIGAATPCSSAATSSKPYHDFSLGHTDPTVTRWTSWPLHLSSKSWSMCEKYILTVRLGTQIHKEDVAMISGLGTHCIFSFINYSEIKQ